MAAIAIAVVGALSAPASAAGHAHGRDADETARTARSVEAVDAPIARAARGHGGSFTAASSDGAIEVELPTGHGAVVLDGGAGRARISVGLPLEAQVDGSKVASDGSVVYTDGSEESSVDVVASVVEDGSVRVETIIGEPGAPHEFTYTLTLPEGARASLTQEGAVLITDQAGEFLGGMQPPWAKDVNGNDVDTHYRLEQGAVVQVVEQVSAQQYPVVADPWLGIALIDKVTKSWVSYKGYRYHVYPSWWGRGGAGWGARWAAWSEAKSKGVPQTGTLQNQFYCHYDYRPVTTFKGSWNLESYSPNMGYAWFVAHVCNY